MAKFKDGDSVSFKACLEAKCRVLQLLDDSPIPHYLVELTRFREEPEQHVASESNLTGKN